MKTLICIVFLVLSVSVFSQHVFGPTGIEFKKNTVYVELSGGGIVPTMFFKETPYDSYKSKSFTGQTEGLGIRIQNTKFISGSVLISYRSQGVYFPDNGNFLLHANYLNLYMPVEFGLTMFKSKHKTSPTVFVFAGPYGACNLGGNVEIGKTELPLTEKEIAKWDAGAEAGVGFRIPTFSLQGKSFLNFKVSYFYGLMNTYPVLASGYPQENVDRFLLSSTGSRTNRGIRFTVGYEISSNGKQRNSTFTAGGDGKKTYKRFLVF